MNQLCVVAKGTSQTRGSARSSLVLNPKIPKFELARLGKTKLALIFPSFIFFVTDQTLNCKEPTKKPELQM